MFEIRETDPSERDSVLGVVTEAFRPGSDALRIAEKTRAKPEIYLPQLDLVAVEGGTIIGHVLVARATVGDETVLALAPLSVAPARQRKGVGSALVRGVIDRADALGYPLIALIGGPEYYSRFGFVPAIPQRITGDSLGLRFPEAFMMRRLSAYSPTIQGPFRYGYSSGTG